MLVEVAPIKVSPPSCNRVPGAAPHEGPASSPSAGDTVSASSDSYDGGGGGEESKSRKLSKVGLRKLKIW